MEEQIFRQKSLTISRTRTICEQFLFYVHSFEASKHNWSKREKNRKSLKDLRDNVFQIVCF